MPYAVCERLLHGGTAGSCVFIQYPKIFNGALAVILIIVVVAVKQLMILYQPGFNAVSQLLILRLYKNIRMEERNIFAAYRLYGSADSGVL